MSVVMTLPSEVKYQIFDYLHFFELVGIFTVSKFWNKFFYTIEFNIIIRSVKEHNRFSSFLTCINLHRATIESDFLSLEAAHKQHCNNSGAYGDTRWIKVHKDIHKSHERDLKLFDIKIKKFDISFQQIAPPDLQEGGRVEPLQLAENYQNYIFQPYLTTLSCHIIHLDALHYNLRLTFNLVGLRALTMSGHPRYVTGTFEFFKIMPNLESLYVPIGDSLFENVGYCPNLTKLVVLVPPVVSTTHTLNIEHIPELSKCIKLKVLQLSALLNTGPPVTSTLAMLTNLNELYIHAHSINSELSNCLKSVNHTKLVLHTPNMYGFNEIAKHIRFSTTIKFLALIDFSIKDNDFVPITFNNRISVIVLKGIK